MATDPFGVSATVNVTIEVTDVNEDPTITGSPAAVVSFAEIGETTALPAYEASDQDDGEQATLMRGRLRAMTQGSLRSSAAPVC